MTVAENLALGDEPRFGPWLRRGAMVLGTVVIYGVEKPGMHYPMVTIVSTVVATNLFLVLELAHPFVGTISTSVDPLQKMEFNASEEKYIQDEVDKFLNLDKWRYEDMPRIMAERREKNGGEVLIKNDLLMTMAWKL